MISKRAPMLGFGPQTLRGEGPVLGGISGASRPKAVVEATEIVARNRPLMTCDKLTEQPVSNHGANFRAVSALVDVFKLNGRIEN